LNANNNSSRIAILAGVLLAGWNAGGGVATASVVSDNPPAWNLTFVDDFDGSSLDATKWANRLPGPRNDAINTPAAVSVGGGVLTINTYTDNGTHYTGMIGSQAKFEQAYGYFEARLKFHTSPGQWSAFWLTSPVYDTGIGNPALYGTEIDVVEHRAVNSNNNPVVGRYVSAVHWDGYGDAHQQEADTHPAQPGLGNDSWHVYGLRWSPAGYDFYYDDTLIWSVTQAVSARPEYMILSSEVRDAGWAGTIPAGGYGPLGTSVTNLQVDYVRAYQSVPEPAAAATLALCLLPCLCWRDLRRERRPAR
jgi:beta-glucanase (GH16 family)